MSQNIERIELVLDRCEPVWKGVGVPEERRREMRDELREHLLEATGEGKSVEEVVGEDPTTFALEWGKPNSAPRDWGGEGVLFGTRSLLWGTTALLVGTHLWRRSLEFPFRMRTVLGHLLFGEIMFTIRDSVLWSAGVYRPEEAPPWILERCRPLGEQLLISSGTTALGLAAFFGVNLVAQGGSRKAFSRWSWRASLTLVAASAILQRVAQSPSENGRGTGRG
jgi:hypothetical protein